MGRKFELLGDRRSVELVDPDFFVVLAGKHVTAVREHDLTTLLYLQRFVRDQGLVQNVHQPYLVTEAHDEMKSRGVEGQSMCLEVTLVEEFLSEHVLRGVRPEPHCAI